MKNITILFLLSLSFIILFSACEKDNEVDTRKLVHPPIFPEDQPDELNNALIILGELLSGNLPQPANPENVDITVTVATASITSGNILFLPLGFSTVNTLRGMYLQVDGADHYWDIPITLNNADANSVVIGITVPNFVQQGNFNATYMLYDDDNNIGNSKTIDVSIVPSENSCDSGSAFPQVSGSDGITVRTYDFGDERGTVSIYYEMYTLKDRMDIRYNNKWEKTTAPELLEEGEAPPIKTCDEVTGADGFVSGTGVFEIDYDPAISREISIYVSGCMLSTTGWDFNVSCPGGPPVEPPNFVCNNTSAQKDYDMDDRDYHSFPSDGQELSTIICDPEVDPNCTAAAVFYSMIQQANFVAPTLDTLPIDNCDILWENILTATNPVICEIDFSNLRVTNYTIANYPDEFGFDRTHVLHPGKVTRTIKIDKDKVVVMTEGEGIGDLTALNDNDYINGFIWTTVDKRLKKYWEEL